MKICNKCQITKPFEQFQRSKRTEDGRLGICRECNRKTEKAYYEKNHDRYKQWRIKNKENQKVKQKAWYQEHKGEYLEKRRADYFANPENRHKRMVRMRARNFLKKYGLSTEQIGKILDKQKGKCAVCLKELDSSKPRSIHIDHCHNTGIVRGILCVRCNSAEGHLGTVENAERLLNYMRSSELFYVGKAA
jgi:hypothetical protein